MRAETFIPSTLSSRKTRVPKIDQNDLKSSEKGMPAHSEDLKCDLEVLTATSMWRCPAIVATLEAYINQVSCGDDMAFQIVSTINKTQEVAISWLKLGERVTGQVDSWRGAVDVFVVWAHEDNEAWDAERQQVRAKEAAKAWREANVEDRSHITSALSLLEDSIKTLDRPAQKGKLRMSTESVAEELFDDASHATTHTYLPDGLPVALAEV